MKKIVVLLILALCSFFLFACGMPKTQTTTESMDAIHIYTLDIGQGDAHLIQVGDEYTLIDSADVSERRRIGFLLKERGVKVLKRVIITHPHTDHLGGMYALINKIPIEAVYDNGYSYPSTAYKTYLKNIKEKKIPLTILRKGDMVELGGNTKLLIMAPGTEQHFLANGKSDANNDSIVAKLIYHDFSMLFTGDAEIIEEKEMLQDYANDLQSTILKVGHHGSNSSTSALFLAAVNPQAAVISVGLGNSYKHPHQGVLKRLTKNNIPIYRTDEDGTIHITTDGYHWNIKKER